MALAWMEKREVLLEGLPRGGILADDQGLGKTISAMALILKNRSPRPVGNDGHGGTLVVCPTSVVRQWAAELKTKSSRKADLTVLLYHGPSRNKHAQELGMYDVVLTTYDIVALENPRPKSWREDGVGYNGDFVDIEQWRVGQARAQSRVENNALKKKNKKRLPGPLSKIKWFRVILDEAQCIRTASTITARAVWGLDTERRSCLSGTPLQNRLGDLQEVEFTPEEAHFYEELRVEVKDKIEQFVKSGNSLMSRFLVLMVYLLQMRQACNHFSLVTKWKEIQSNKGVEANVTEELCVVCHDIATSLAATSCGHVCCQDCVDVDKGTCPLCDSALQSYDTKTSSTSWLDNQDTKMTNKKWGCSSKIKAAMDKIRAIPIGEKALVFSQWTGMLDLLEQPLKKMGVKFCRLDGTMSIAARDQAVHSFNNDPSVRVILMSLKAASLGLNMIAASRVLLLDAWWNPTVEEQAIDRAHRIGQTRPVIVTRFYMKRSVEERVLQIQDKKKEMVELALGEGEIGDIIHNKLTEEDFRSLFDTHESGDL